MAIAPSSASRAQAPKKRKAGCRDVRVGFWAILGVAVLLVSGVVWFTVSSLSKDGAENDSDTRNGLIAAVDPSLAGGKEQQGSTTSEFTAGEAAQAEATNAQPAVATTGSRPKNFRVVKPKNRGKKLFHNISDIHISRLVNATPGRAMIGTMNYDRFAEQFKKSLDTPIVIEEDDTPEEVAAKQNVIETRAELKKMLDNGEDIAQVMRETESELRRLYNYRQNLSKELAQAFRERKFSADDMQDYINAANKMLKDNDMEPLKHPEFWVRQLRVMEASGE